MSLNILGSRKTKDMARVTGLPIVWVAVNSSYFSGRYAFGATGDCVHVWWDRKTDSWGIDQELHGMFSACRRRSE